MLSCHELIRWVQYLKVKEMRENGFVLLISHYLSRENASVLFISLSLTLSSTVSLKHALSHTHFHSISLSLTKVLVSPHAVIADGGAICSSGHLMVATAAKVSLHKIVKLIIE